MIAPALFFIASILPPSIDDWKRVETGKAELPQPNVAHEYGLIESDSAKYSAGAKTFELSAYRLKDVTGAVALEQSLQDPGKKVFRYQNYVFQTTTGTAPRGAIDAFLFPALPKLDHSAGPNMLPYLPAKNRVSGTERLILGPESLRAFEPRISVVAAGFDFAGEMQLAHFTTPDGKAVLAVLRFPNHAIARQQFPALEQIGTAVRQGPLVSLVLPLSADHPLKAETAQALASLVAYKADIVMDKKPDKPQENPAVFLVNVFKLCGVLLGLCLGLGLLFALVRAYGRHWSGRENEPELTSLGI